MSTATGSLPKELEPLREWLEARRPYKEKTLEETLSAETSVFINAPRALMETGFQEAVWALRDAIAQGKVSIRRRVREKPVEPIDPHDPPVRWPAP